MEEPIVANPVIGDGEETPTVTPAEEQTPEANEPAPEGDNTPVEPPKEPWHTDPRWMKMWDKSQQFDELQEQNRMLEERLTELDTKVSSKEPEIIPDAFKELYGDNPESWKKFKGMLDERDKNLLEKWQGEQEKKAQEIEAAKQYWTEWTERQFEELGITDEAEKNAVSQFVRTEDIRDANGFLDIKKGYKFYNQLNPKEPNKARKEVAGLTSSKPTGEPEKRTFAISEDFQGKNWGDL